MVGGVDMVEAVRPTKSDRRSIRSEQNQLNPVIFPSDEIVGRGVVMQRVVAFSGEDEVNHVKVVVGHADAVVESVVVAVVEIGEGIVVCHLCFVEDAVTVIIDVLEIPNPVTVEIARCGVIDVWNAVVVVITVCVVSGIVTVVVVVAVVVLVVEHPLLRGIRKRAHLTERALHDWI